MTNILVASAKVIVTNNIRTVDVSNPEGDAELERV